MTMSLLRRTILCCLVLVPVFLTGVPARAANEPPTQLETTLLRFAGKYYAITLAATATRRSLADIKKAFPNLIVYQTQVNVAGTRLHFLRIGFFATEAEAELLLPRVRVGYPDAWVIETTPIEQSTALGVDLETLAAATTQPEPPAATAPTADAVKLSGNYAVQLDVAEIPQFTLPVLSPALQRYRFYVLHTTGTRGEEYRLNLGVFGDLVEADRARKQLLARFPHATVREISSGEKSQVAALPARTTPGATPPAPGSETTDSKAKSLLQHAQDQIIAHQYDAAIKTLTEILMLPRNLHTADAVEYTGVAYDRAGQTKQAILHYQVYLRVYPDGPGADRVRQRLQALLAAPPPPAAPAPTAVAGLHETRVFGTFSQFYNHGATRSTINVPTAGEQPLLTDTVQSSIVTSLNMTTAYQTERFDNRFILRDVYTYSHTPDQPYSTLAPYDTTNYLSAAYFENKDKLLGTTVRLGRMTGTSWGIFGRYDGGQFIYSLAPGWRLAVTAGTPQEYSVDASRYFYGATVDVGPLAKHWYGNLYYVRQEVNGYLDRESVGTEVRFSDTLHSAYTLFDYDTSYEILNVGVVQLNWRTAGAMTYNLLIDHRLLPTLQTTNAVFGNLSYDQSFSQLEDALNQGLITLAEIRQLALDRTVTANNVNVGVNWQANNTWQFGGDVRLYNVSGVPAIDTNPAIPATGDIYVYTVQARRTGLFSPRDVTQVSLGHKTGDSVDGNILTFSNTTMLGQSFTLNSRLRLSDERTRSSFVDAVTSNPVVSRSDSLIVSPSLRLSYRFRSRMTFEAEYGLEHSTATTDDYDTVLMTRTRTPSDLTLRYFSLGYRWNF